jgi:hypothetical protein
LPRVVLPLVLFAAVAAAAYSPAPAPRIDRAAAPADTEWVWPENPENLEVLPDDIGAAGLEAVMRSFTRSLGVRCSHCHVGQGDFLNWDFASDENGHKDIAREMMRMTRQINVDLLDDIEGLHPVDEGAGHAGFRVTCWTCHRGNSTPETMPPPEEEAAPPPAPAPAGQEGQGGHQHEGQQQQQHDHPDSP